MKTIRYLSISLFVATLLFTTLIFALEPVFNQFGSAIRGYDPVAYFKESKAVRGYSQFSFNWNGATWYFSSAENRDDFITNPKQYAPQYGGYCAYAVSRGYTASTKPDAWSIVDGKLYLNYNKATRKVWSKDIPDNINQANQNWPNLLKNN